MATIRPIRDVPPEPIPLHTHALDNLRYIRETMERAGSFTAVPGWGGVLMGVTALAAAGFASHAQSRGMWLAIWLSEALVAMGVGVLAMRRKARAAGLPLWSAPARKFVFSFFPSLFAGAVLTAALLVPASAGFGASAFFWQAERVNAQAAAAANSRVVFMELSRIVGRASNTRP
jgi:hypothetical protein